MKKTVLSIAVVTGLLYGANGGDVKRIQTMQNLETGISTIQKGIMYNNHGIVEQGVKKLVYNAKDIESFQIRHSTGKQFDEKKFANNEAKALEMLAKKILKDFDSGNKEQVLDTYQKLQRQCVTCHALVRKW